MRILLVHNIYTVLRDFIYVTDLAALCVKVAEKRMTGIFNAGNGTGHSLRAVLDELRTATGIDVAPVYKPGRPYDVPHSVLDMASLRAVSWVPTVPLGAGLQQTWNWVEGQV